jgi:hypothetical protein
MSIKYLLKFVLLIGVAEVGSSFWLLSRAPVDGPTYFYNGFPDYEIGRLVCWLPLTALVSLLWVALSRTSGFGGAKTILGNDQSRKYGPYLILAFAIGFAIETFTSVCYWMIPYSVGVRSLYESGWYWHRVPQQSDYGWPSFKGYFLDHMIPWAVLFLVGLVIWLTWGRRRAGQH